MIPLSPEDDDTRRRLHTLRFEGAPIHLLERPAPASDAEAVDDAATFATHALRAQSVVRPAAGTSSARGDPPAAAAMHAVVSTTSLPGPAHKERIAVWLRDGCPRSVFFPLHVPMYTREVRVRVSGVGASVVAIGAMRLFAHERAPREVDMLAVPPFVRVAGGTAMPAPPVRALTADGTVDFVLSIPALWAGGDVWHAAELTLVVTPVRGGPLSHAATALLDAAYADPWDGVESIEHALARRGARAVQR